MPVIILLDVAGMSIFTEEIFRRTVAVVSLLAASAKVLTSFGLFCFAMVYGRACLSVIIQRSSIWTIALAT